MKILHCSDIHLGKRPIGKKEYSTIRYNDYFDAFANIVDYAVKNSVDAFLIAGDFFDRKEIFPEILAKAETILNRLKKAKIKVLLIEGNHDKIYADKQDESWLVYLQEKKLVTLLESKSVDDGFEFGKISIDDVNFYGVGYFGSFTDAVVEGIADHLTGPSAPLRDLEAGESEDGSENGLEDVEGVEEVELDLFGNPVVDEQNGSVSQSPGISALRLRSGTTPLDDLSSPKNVVLIHTALGDGSEESFFPGTVSPESLKRLEGKAIYVAGGHFHSHSVYPAKKSDSRVPFFFVPGAPEYWDLAERGKRGFIVFDTDSKEHEFVESTKRSKIDLTFSISAETASEFTEKFEAKINESNITIGCLVYLKLTLENSITVDVNSCEDYIEELGALKALIRVEYSIDTMGVSGKKREFSITDIEKDVISSMGEFSDHTDKIVNSLTTMKTNFNEKNEDLFFESYLAMINTLVEEGEDE